MTKYAGLSIVYTLDDSSGSGVNISNDVGTITMNTTRGEQDVTGLDKTAMERLQLLEDTDVTFGGSGFPSSTTLAVFQNLANSRTLVIDYPNSATATVEVMLFSFNVKRDQNGGMSWEANGKLANGTKLAWS